MFMSTIDLLVKHIASVRNHVLPKTSYNTAGQSSATLNVYVDPENLNFKSLSKDVSSLLLSNTVFDHILDLSIDNNEVMKHTYGYCIALYGNINTDKINQIKSFFMNNKIRLVIFIDRYTNQNQFLSIRFSKELQEFTTFEQQCDDICITSCYHYKSSTFIPHLSNASMNTAGLMKEGRIVSHQKSLVGFNMQPSVKSKSQFYYLWNTSVQLESDTTNQQNPISSYNSNTIITKKFSKNQWDELIQQVLLSKHSSMSSSVTSRDYEIYDMIRKYTLGTSLAQDSSINTCKLSLPTIDYSGNKNESKTRDVSKTVDTESANEDGRANFMVDRAIECIPTQFLQRLSKASIGISHPTATAATRYMLDYGCAEGAITAALGKKLGLSPHQIIGADVRSIPSDGFTFIQLASEDPIQPPELGTILPSLRDHSIDLITASMVFHHVTHIKAVLLELRRVIALDGLLVIREHHCTSPDMGAFLDITHGLYSLSWSNPIEWPAFTEEYEAYYRSQDEWNELLAEAGFTLCMEELEGSKGISYYNNVKRSTKSKGNDNFPNVIKAYYAIYRPQKNFKLPIIQKNMSKTEQIGNITFDKSLKRPFTEISDIDNSNEIRKDVVINTSNNNINSSNHNIAVSHHSKNLSSSNNNNRNTNNVSNIVNVKDEILESKKYPGRFYKINKITGVSEWIS